MESEKPNILIVDDRQENLLALEALLENKDLNVLRAQSGNEALGLMLENDFVLVLMDVQMPDMDGFETAQLMRGSEKTKHVPIIFVSAISKDQKNVFKGYEAGAVDYIFKPIDPYILQSKVDVFLEIYHQKMALEEKNRVLSRTIGELEKANKKIIEQQKSVIEEERLKVLLQMAGATAHELNQPLTSLLGNIELIGMAKDNPDKTDRYLLRIKEAGERISDIVSKIQNIRHDKTKQYLGRSDIINIHQRARLLVVENSDDNFEVLNRSLEQLKWIDSNRVCTIKEGLGLLEQGMADIVFLSYNLPDGNGMEFINELENYGLDTPVVVITGEGDGMIAAKVIQAGAYDFMTRDNMDQDIISKTITNTLEKFRLQKDLKAAHNKLVEMSIQDELTGLYNRRYFNEALDRETSRAKRYSTGLVLCMLDLDHFKIINDDYGHTAGDFVLGEVARLFEEQIRDSDICCRYGGEEFAIILPNTDISNAYNVCERIREKVSMHKFEYSSTIMQVTISIGISQYWDTNEQTSAQLIETADKALYYAKEKGRNMVFTLPA